MSLLLVSCPGRVASQTELLVDCPGRVEVGYLEVACPGRVTLQGAEIEVPCPGRVWAWTPEYAAFFLDPDL